MLGSRVLLGIVLAEFPKQFRPRDGSAVHCFCWSSISPCTPREGRMQLMIIVSCLGVRHSLLAFSRIFNTVFVLVRR